ncbi:Zinc finger, RING-type [Dillenia turbinata]|uniref:RING-type E3 ubiquitin transferase n=1 Tax=Dillenia turbinata TaxID=194707 RepID=A0AAN8V5P8_9MAGN
MAAVFKPLPLFFFLLFLFPNFKPSSSSSASQNDTVSTSANNISGGLADANIPPPPPSIEKLNGSPFKPSIAVIIAVLTILFSVTFLLLLYAKHCKRSTATSNSRGGGALQSSARKNSGVDRTIVESLPVFRFASLRGQKEGLECAVCITKFEPSEVLRLLPKCKHAFHVECVDTWLDAHSTCPLCRYRVDPEDILLVDENTHLESGSRRASSNKGESFDSELPSFRRVSGRHSSAGERGTGLIQIVVQKSNESSDSVASNHNNRRSLDSLRNQNSAVTVGCFDRHRKDGLLLNADKEEEEEEEERERERFEHRIIVSGHDQHRWSDVQPSDFLYLQSEMIMNGYWPSTWRGGERQVQLHLNDGSGRVGEEEDNHGGDQAERNKNSGKNVINVRCVSEITGLSRFSSADKDKRDHKQRQAGVVSRWKAWISQSRPPVRSPAPPDDVP